MRVWLKIPARSAQREFYPLTPPRWEDLLALFGERGGRTVEGYPTEAAKQQADAFVWTGVASSVRQAGFKEVMRRSETRPIMRYEVRKRT